MTATLNPLDFWAGSRIGLGDGRVPSRADIEAWQLRQLRQTLDLACRGSAFYRRHLASLADRPPTSLADLTRYPFTTAADIEADPLRFVCGSQSDIQRVVTLDTSGTTGRPKRIFFTAEDQEITLGFFQHGLRQMTAPGDRVLILLPGEAPGSVGELLFRAIRRLSALPVPAGFPRDVEATAALGWQNRVNLVIGIPVQVLALARQWRERGRRGRAPARVLLCSDHISDAICRELTALWHCEIFRDWGMTELGYCGGVDCSAHQGYHLQEADFLFEIVDPATGCPLPTGELGEVVFTTLTRRGMPLIRYRTGDLARLAANSCPCGSILRRLEGIATRKTGVISLDGGDLSMPVLDELLFRVPGVVDFAACLGQESNGGTLRIEVTPGADMPAQRLPSFQAAVEAALGTLPVLLGGLALEVTVRTEAAPPTRQKRMIRLERAS